MNRHDASAKRSRQWPQPAQRSMTRRARSSAVALVIAFLADRSASLCFKLALGHAFEQPGDPRVDALACLCRELDDRQIAANRGDVGAGSRHVELVDVR